MALGPSCPEARRTWYGRLGRAYHVRSVIVHGSTKDLRKLTDEETEEVLEYIDEALRSVLREVLVNSRTHEDWRLHLESIVLG